MAGANPYYAQGPWPSGTPITYTAAPRANPGSQATPYSRYTTTVAQPAITASQIPKFYFRVRAMRQNPNVPPRHVNGIWFPLNSGGSHIHDARRDIGEGAVYEFNGECCRGFAHSANELIANPGFVLFQTVSVYYYAGSFHCVPFDATIAGFGDLADRTGPAPADNDADSDSDGLFEDDDDGGDRTWDWRLMGFNHVGMKSIACFPATQQLLASQRPDQEPWINQLLPEHMHALPMYRNAVYPNGGVSGHLALMIALIVFSVRRSNAVTALWNCIRGSPHNRWSYHAFDGEDGRRNGRGLIVEVWRYHDTPPQLLDYYESNCIYP